MLFSKNILLNLLDTGFSISLLLLVIIIADILNLSSYSLISFLYAARPPRSTLAALTIKGVKPLVTSLGLGPIPSIIKGTGDPTPKPANLSSHTFKNFCKGRAFVSIEKRIASQFSYSVFFVKNHFFCIDHDFPSPNSHMSNHFLV